ncbi:hypothetical protein SDC9_110763 [bioreactor metagenome]|uniref:Uncharacterized protein n=1 Tax=bioreactor metagenome TaxID=1076179 RepID=A0A645BEL0_9ZZZZ
MQSVGQFDDDDPYVLGSGQKHFAQVFNLLLFLAGVGDFTEFRHAGDKGSHIGAEVPFDLFFSNFCVLDHIVQQG